MGVLNAAVVSGGLISDAYPLGAPSTVTRIGIRIDLSLSAGDSATLASHYELTPTTVPLPGALLLGAIGVLAKFRRRPA